MYLNGYDTERRAVSIVVIVVIIKTKKEGQGVLLSVPSLNPPLSLPTQRPLKLPLLSLAAADAYHWLLC
jgi:hypothetical protein